MTKRILEGADARFHHDVYRKLGLNCSIRPVKKLFDRTGAPSKLQENDLLKQFSLLEGASHGNFIRIYDLLQDEKTYYLVTERVSDHTL